MGNELPEMGKNWSKLVQRFQMVQNCRPAFYLFVLITIIILNIVCFQMESLVFCLLIKRKEGGGGTPTDGYCDL